MLAAVEWLNYHHLFYFWNVARERGLVQAGRVLNLSHPTLSKQIHQLEEQFGEKLFVRAGRRLELSDVGHVVYRYAEEIFSLGREMQDTLKGRATGQPLRLSVGIAQPVPKVIVRRLIEPAFQLDEPIKLQCYENEYSKLLASLALHTLDIVITDAAVPPGSNIRAFAHALGQCGVTLFATRALATKYQQGFPRCLNDAPLLLPLPDLTLRRALDQWFAKLNIRPKIIAEFEDSALLSAFGADGLGLFPGPTAVEREICKQHGVKVVGRIKEVTERFYAISIQRRLQNPAVVAICNAARQELFGRRRMKPIQ